MKYENGKIILEPHSCYQCEGTLVVDEHKQCPRYGMQQRGKKCPHCETKNKSHLYLKTGLRIQCPSCKGTGQIMERPDSHIPQAIFPLWWKDVDITIVRDTKYRSGFNEQYLGLGYVYCCTDYGRCFDANPTPTKEWLGEWLSRDSRTFNADCSQKLHCIIHQNGISIVARK